MLPFWNELYDNVLLEYMYVNKLNWPVPHIEVVRSERFEIPPVGVVRSDSFDVPHSDKYNSNEKQTVVNHDDLEDNRILLPLGGNIYMYIYIYIYVYIYVYIQHIYMYV
jgi:hypothetical protein